jgi:hypothetical protein
VQDRAGGGVRPPVLLPDSLVDLIEKPSEDHLGLALVPTRRPRGISLRSQIFLPVSWSIPAHTFTRADPLGSHPIVPRWRARDGRREATGGRVQPVEATKEATRERELAVDSRSTCP